ncbi:MAG: hypothetical protein M1839_001717 [Geoglossum umbratile]|nr:MAG: hypothetical protein M1839_001717 [Geoglossum umbratile]
MAEGFPFGVTVLHTPEKPIQIVFEQSRVMWLRDLLPKAIPNIRTMTYGYNAKFRNFTGDQSLRDISKKLLTDLVDLRRTKEEMNRPIVFICHSLGGIVAKKALLLFCLEEQTKVQKAVYGIIFLATPHNGSSIAACGKVIANIVTACTPMHPPGKLLSALGPKSAVLFEITENFVKKSPDLQLVVEYHSAILNLPNEVTIPQHADHREIARFESLHDRNFRAVLTRIDIFKEGILAKLKSITQDKPEVSSGGDPEIFEIPLLPCDSFHGREDLLNGMEEYFHGSTPRSPKQLRYAICGLGGSGKTQAALKFAFRNRMRYKSGVLFFNANSHTTLIADFSRVAELLKLESAVNRVDSLKRWLSRPGNSDWLLIFDNADHLEALSISKYFPATPWGHIIITSRDNAAIGSAGEWGASVDPLKPEEAVAVLFEKVGIRTPTGEDYKEARAIVETLGCLPLAVDHCGAYIRTRQKTLAEYRRLFQERQHEVLGCKHRLGENNKTVLATWEVNFRQVERDSKKASTLLLLFCFLDAAYIPEAMLSRAFMPQKRWDRHGEITETDVAESGLDRELVELIKNEVEFDTAIDKLLSFSLIYRNKDVGGSRNFSVHPLVQYCASQRVNPATQAKWRLQAILLVCQVFPRYPYLEPLYGDLGRSQLPHVHRILKEHDTLEKHSSSPVPVRRELCSMLISASRFSDTTWKREVISRIKGLLNDDLDCYIHAEAAHRESAILRLGGGKGSSNKRLEIFIHSTVFPGHGKEMDADARWNANRGDLVVSYAENLIHTGALARAREELCEWEPIVPDFPSTIERLVLRSRDISLGRVLRFEGRFAEALKLFKGILNESQQDDLYKESSWYPVIISHIADMYCELGQPAEAQEMAEPALAQLVRRGWQHVSYGRRLQLALAEALILLGSYTMAEEHLRSLIMQYEPIVHPDVPTRTGHFRAWTGLARIAHMARRWDEALTRWRQALAQLEGFRKGESFVGGVVWYSIAHCLVEVGRKAESEEALARVRGWVAGGREFWDLGFGTYWYDFVMGAMGEEIMEMRELKV